MNIHLDVAILIFGDSNHYLNEKKQCANEYHKEKGKLFI